MEWKVPMFEKVQAQAWRFLPRTLIMLLKTRNCQSRSHTNKWITNVVPSQIIVCNNWRKLHLSGQLLQEGPKLQRRALRDYSYSTGNIKHKHFGNIENDSENVTLDRS
jgi:hypothetical protein